MMLLKAWNKLQRRVRKQFCIFVCGLMVLVVISPQPAQAKTMGCEKVWINDSPLICCFYKMGGVYCQPIEAYC